MNNQSEIDRKVWTMCEQLAPHKVFRWKEDKCDETVDRELHDS